MNRKAKDKSSIPYWYEEVPFVLLALPSGQVDKVLACVGWVTRHIHKALHVLTATKTTDYIPICWKSEASTYLSCLYELHCFNRK